ncbi:hypothetical protein [Streptomyces sp. MMG1121]|uniref:hypothetical protein n=1 Tax=Streptomyces sp. MMG1121 TaxID=1415544 RepID=UPI003B639623
MSERNGFVFVWYEPDGAAPSWEVPDTAQAGVVPTAAWSTEVHAYAQEIIENTLDYRHLPVLHNVAVEELAAPVAEGPLLRLRLRLGPDRPPALKQKIQADHAFLIAGLGYLRVELPLPSLGLVSYLCAMHTPTGPRRTRMLVATACADIRKQDATGASLPRRGPHRAFARAMRHHPRPGQRRRLSPGPGDQRRHRDPDRRHGTRHCRHRGCLAFPQP